MAPGRYRVLVIGCGNIAGQFDVGRAPNLPPLTHAGAYTRHGGFQLLACVDPDERRRARFAESWGVEIQAPNMQSLTELNATIDVVSICSPTVMHADHLVRALDLAPKAVFCEKPIAPDEVTADDLVRTYHERGVTLVVNYSRYWDPSVTEMIRSVRAGAWGDVRSVVGHYNKGILNNGGHLVEMLLRLLGPLEAIATGKPVFDFWESDPTVPAMLTAGGGTIPVYLSPSDARDYACFELEIFCSLGVIRMHSGGMGWQFREVMASQTFRGYKSLGSVRDSPGRYQESMFLAVGDIHGCLSGRTPALGETASRALQVQRLCEKIRRMSLGANSDTDHRGEA